MDCDVQDTCVCSLSLPQCVAEPLPTAPNVAWLSGTSAAAQNVTPGLSVPPSRDQAGARVWLSGETNSPVSHLEPESIVESCIFGYGFWGSLRFVAAMGLKKWSY